jgi:hypothetical protein
MFITKALLLLIQGSSVLRSGPQGFARKLAFVKTCPDPLKHLRLCEVSIRCGQFAIKPASAVSRSREVTVSSGNSPMGGSHKTICGLAVELYDFPSCHFLAFQSSEFSFNGVEFCFEFFYSRNKKRNGVGVMKD